MSGKCRRAATNGHEGQTTTQRFGRIDVLINNAGYGIIGAVEETPDSELRALMETNFFGAVAVIKAALPALRAQRSGAIVNISSLGGQMSFAGFSAYSASKFAVRGFSESLRHELAMSNSTLRLSVVHPGGVKTNIARKARSGAHLRESVSSSELGNRFEQFERRSEATS